MRGTGWPACALLLAACLGSSRPSRFYTLVPLEAHEVRAPERPARTLALGPVEIPEVLDRKPIVTRSGANELVLADFDRWGGSLRDEVERALSAELGERLAPRGVAVVLRRAAALRATAPDLRATVTIARFDGVLGDSVVLRARWEVSAPGEARPLAARDSTFTERLGGAGYDALVAGMQRAVQRLGAELAAGVAALAGAPAAAALPPAG